MLGFGEILSHAGVFVFAWVAVFLLHELGHIKSQGFLARGSIYVSKLSMTATPEYTKNWEWFKLSGGVLAGTASVIFGYLLCDPWASACFVSIGLANIAYGFFEWGFLGKLNDLEYTTYRYTIYLITILTYMFISRAL